MIQARRWGNASIALIAALLMVLPGWRALLVERTYGTAANCDGCVGWASLGNDAWLAAIGLVALGLGLTMPSRWVRTGFALVAFALAVLMVIDTLLLDLLSLRLHMADVLKFGGEGRASLDFIMAAVRGGHWPLLMALLVLLVALLALFFPASKKPRCAALMVLLGLVMLVGGGFLGRMADGYIHSEGVVNLLQLQRMRGVDTPYSEAFIQRALAAPEQAEEVCEAGQGRRPDVVLLIVESLSAYHSDLLGGYGHVPELDAIAQSNAWFDDFHANGFTTDQGLIALLDGRLPIPAVGRYLSLRAFDGFGDPQRSVVGTLRAQGYQAAFFTTGDLGFLDKKTWLRRMQIDHFEGAESAYYDGMPRGGFNAASDEALYGRFLQWLEVGRDASKPLFAALLTVDTHPPFLDQKTGRIDEEAVFRQADAALGQFHAQLLERGFFDSGGILIITGDHRSMTAVGRDEWLRHAYSTLARVPLVVVGAGGLPKGRIAGLFQQTDLMPSLAHLVTRGQVCRRQGQGSFLRVDPRPSAYAVHARGDRRGRIDVYYPDGAGWIDLNGDASGVGGLRVEMTRKIADAIHRDRIERGALRQDMAPMLMDASRQRLQGRSQ